MQLIEFFLWRNLNNPRLNNLFSIMGSLLLIIQPIASLLILKDDNLKYKLITIYSLVAFSYFIYQNYDHKMITIVSKSGHLAWKWAEFSGYTKILYLLWFVTAFYSLFVNKYYEAIIYAFILIFISYYSYHKDGSAGSLWCWSLNSIMLYYAFKLLIWLPFKENGIC